MRNDASGIYYARCRVGGGRRAAMSLDTRSLEAARLGLVKALTTLRARANRLHGPGLTFGDAATAYLERLRLHGNPKRGPLKPRSLKYRAETIAQWRGLIDGFDSRLVASTSKDDLQEWADRARRKYGDTRYNGMVESLRGIYTTAMEAGAVETNLALAIRRKKVRLTQKEIPTREQVREILRLLDAHPRRKHARLTVRLLMFTGLRPNEAKHLEAADVNVKAGTLTARETKNSKPRTIQLIAQAQKLFEKEGVEKVVAAARKHPRRTLNTIGRLVGLKLTPYTMRHLHMTALVESGVDLPSAAMIAGQQDRGVTLLRHYLHSRPDHIRAQLKKIRI